MRRWKALVGICLILFAAGGFVFWELQGRELLMTDSVLVAAENIPEGTVVTAKQFTTRAVYKDDLMKGALKPSALRSLEGKVAAGTIAANSQISKESFRQEAVGLAAGKSVFVLPEEWIAMRSSSLRKGDRIDVYGAETMEPLGSYEVAFVKDESELEVVDADGKKSGRVLERGDATAKVSSVEIIAGLEQYKRLRMYCTQPYGTLVLIQRGEVTAS